MILSYILQVTLCLGCFYSLYHFALRKETLFRTNRMYLVVTLLMSFILPWVKIYVDSRMTTASMIAMPSQYVGEYLAYLTDPIVIRPQIDAFPWGKVLLALYTTVVALLSIRMVKAILDILAIRRSGQTAEVDGVTCVTSDRVKAPFSFFSTIYLPGDHAFNHQHLAEIMAHESAHVRARHTWDVLLMEITCIGLWPSPLVYLYRKALKEVHEYAADAEVIRNTPWENYAQLLVTQQQHHLQHILSNQFYSQLKKRLLMMNQKPSALTARYKYLGMVPLLAIALLAFSFRISSEGFTDQLSGLAEMPLHSYPEATMDMYEDGLDAFSTVYASKEVNGQEHEPEPLTPWRVSGDMPIFPGCSSVSREDQASCSKSRLMEYVINHLEYPEALRSEGTEGKVLIRFVVTAGGWVARAEVIQSLSPEADQAALDMVNSMNQTAGKWQPAIKEGKAVDVELVLPVTFAIRQQETESPFTYVEEMPRFPGCEHISEEKERFTCVMEKMYQFIGNHLRYPEGDKDNHVQGAGIVQFVVQADGQLADVKVLRSPSPAMTAEMIRLMQEMSLMPERWIPGRHEGKAVPVMFTLPIKFQLQETKPSDATGDAASKEVKADHQLEVTPNPASTRLTVRTFSGAHTIQISGMDGKIVATRKVDPGSNEHQLDVSGLPMGQYIVNALNDVISTTATFTIAR